MTAYNGVGLGREPGRRAAARVRDRRAERGWQPHDRFAVVESGDRPDDRQGEGEEGCLSMPGVLEDVVRATHVRACAASTSTATAGARGRGLSARAVQHESDHLDGVLFTDRLSALKRQFLQRDLDALARGELPEGYHPGARGEHLREACGEAAHRVHGHARVRGPRAARGGDVCDVARVVTQPDRPSGRGSQPRESAGRPGRRASSACTSCVRRHEGSLGESTSFAARADVFAVVAFGAILTPAVLALPRARLREPARLAAAGLPRRLAGAARLWDGRTETGVMHAVHGRGHRHRRRDRLPARADPRRRRRGHAGHAARVRSAAHCSPRACCRRRRDAPRGVFRIARRAATRRSSGRKTASWTGRCPCAWCGRTRARSRRGRGRPRAFAETRLPLTQTRPDEAAARRRAGHAARERWGGLAWRAPMALRVTRLKPEGRAELDAAEWARGARPQPGERFESLKEQTT